MKIYYFNILLENIFHGKNITKHIDGPFPDENGRLQGISKKTRVGFPGGSVVKTLPAKEEDMGPIPDPGRSHMPWSN